MQPSITFCAGNIYVDAELYEKYFPGLHTVAVLRRDDDLLILPIQQQGGGGLLMKIRNARGDRVIHAWETLHAHGLDSATRSTHAARWDSAAAALRITISGEPDLSN